MTSISATAIGDIVHTVWLKAYDRGRFSTASKHGTYADVVPKATADILAVVTAAPAPAHQAEPVAKMAVALENLLIAVGMGWDLDGVAQVVRDTIAEQSGSQFVGEVSSLVAARYAIPPKAAGALAVADIMSAAHIACAIHSQYPITTDFDRGYDKARKDAAVAVKRKLTELFDATQTNRVRP
jgi:hypothetical protein